MIDENPIDPERQLRGERVILWLREQINSDLMLDFLDLTLNPRTRTFDDNDKCTCSVNDGDCENCL